MTRGHALVFTYSLQGHINPTLQFAKRLVNMGMKVTFLTSISGHRHLTAKAPTEGLEFSAFSDGFDDGFKPETDDVATYMSELKNNSTEAMREIITASTEKGCPVTCLVYSIILSWADKVARDLHVPCAVLWIQAATVLDIYQYYYNGNQEFILDNSNDPSWAIKLPNLPLPLAARDLPSFILPQKSKSEFERKFLVPVFKEQFDTLNGQENPKVLVNSFDALEPETVKAVSKYNLIAIGPLIPSAFLDGKDPTDTSFGGDLFEKSSNYVDWLSTKPESSVVYVAFGSLLMLAKQQMEEIARGLLECKRPFIWVIRNKKMEVKEDIEGLTGYVEELENNGMIVPWCSQVEVLSHPSVGCFVTHCGWNSTLESLAVGVPTVAFSQWSDQTTNAKLVEDVWETGVRVRENEEGIVEGGEIKRCIEMVMGEEGLVRRENEEGIVEGGEIKRCIEMVMGEEGLVRRENAKKWKDLARRAVEDGGSSDINLKAFVEEIASHRTV